MNRNKLIKKIIGEAISPYGFSMEYSDKSGTSFVKEDGELKQYISVDTVNIEYLRLQFSTNAYLQRTIDWDELLPEKRPITYLMPGIPEPSSLWKWKTESDFIEILEVFKDIILKYGFKALEEISVPATEIRPTTQTDWELYENHDELNRKYRKLLGIENESSTRKIVERIESKLMETQGREFEDVKEMLIGLAAVYGTAIIAKRGGEWQWREDFDKICWIKTGEKKKKSSGTYPLNDIITYWRDGGYLRDGKTDIEQLLYIFRTYREEKIT